ncbi:MAG: FMN-binding protein [Elusimicrobia bacterium]|nr:FMN-binding protein [Elusimicrobiota bacterium]
MNSKILIKTAASSLKLAFLCMISALLISQLYLAIEPVIKQRKTETLILLYRQVLPNSAWFENKTAGNREFIAGFDKQHVQRGKIVKLNVRDYNGDIEILFGVDQENRILGIKILNADFRINLEDDSSKSDFFKKFIGLKFHDLKLEKNGKDISIIPGADVSSKAYIKALKKAVEEVESINATEQ